MKKVTLIPHKNTHHTIPCKKSYFFLSKKFLLSPVPLFLFHFRGEVEDVLFFLMAPCLHKKFQAK